MSNLLEKTKTIRSKRVVFIPREFIIATEGFGPGDELNIHNGLGNIESREFVNSIMPTYSSFTTLKREHQGDSLIVLRNYETIGETSEGFVFKEESQMPYSKGNGSYKELDQKMKEAGK